MEDVLSEAMQRLGEEVEVEDEKRIKKAEETARRIAQAAIEDTMRKIESGEFDDPDKWDYGDGDQSDLPSPDYSIEAQKLKSLWGEQ